MPYVALTVDLDRDYPVPVSGKIKAASYSPECKPSFTCTIKGLRALIGFLEETGVKATFFIEARTLHHIQALEDALVSAITKNEVGCHGMDHEDLAGKYTGVPIPPHKQLALIRKATEIISKITGLKPTGFRAPYLSTTPNLGEILRNLNYKYDSSMYLESFKPPHPYLLGCKVFEVPLPLYPLGEKKATLYTWALHEGKRSVDDFKRILDAYLENDDGGLLIISTHAWHLAYKISSNLKLSSREVRENISLFYNFLTYLEDKGASLVSIERYLKEVKK
ncbi:MAG: polysaccharide deacetylase family protein [Candidatus Freyarchaeota archaeon]|nr:polysaccharide deacetylase family protein [Candidatus Jordarchaeia archaeon]